MESPLIVSQSSSSPVVSGKDGPQLDNLGDFLVIDLCFSPVAPRQKVPLVTLLATCMLDFWC